MVYGDDFLHDIIGSLIVHYYKLNKPIFRMFFFDGNEIHVAAIERILQKLRNIIELIKLCDSVRLYCCSLLLVYESDKTAKLNYKVIITLISSLYVMNVHGKSWG